MNPQGGGGQVALSIVGAPGAVTAFGDDLVGRDALAVLGIAPTPILGRKLALLAVDALHALSVTRASSVIMALEPC